MDRSLLKEWNWCVGADLHFKINTQTGTNSSKISPPPPLGERKSRNQLKVLATLRPLFCCMFCGCRNRKKQFTCPENVFCRLTVNSSGADSLTCVPTPPRATACINIYGHVKDLVVHVRVRWTMETLKYPACTEGWVARLCRS